MFEPRYLITHGILRNVGQIDAAREVIRNAAISSSQEAKFQQDALVRSVHHGAKIEGNSLSHDQAEKLVMLDSTDAQKASLQTNVSVQEPEIQEILNYREVLKWIDSWGQKHEHAIEYSEDILKTIHKKTVTHILDEAEGGQYRQVQVAIKNSQTGETTFMPPPAVEVPYQLEDFFAWLNSDEGRLHHPILRAGITHYELIRIHPFVEGNGCTARTMALLVLYNEGYEVKRFFSLEEYFDSDPQRYYQALASVGEGESMDLTYWLEYFTLGLGSELEKVKDKVLKLHKDANFNKVKPQKKQVALSERQIKLIEAMKRNDGRITTSEANKVLPMVSPDTVLRDFKDLIKKGLIKKKGKTKGAYYVLKN